jgi:hypothetical protein
LLRSKRDFIWTADNGQILWQTTLALHVAGTSSACSSAGKILLVIEKAVVGEVEAIWRLTICTETAWSVDPDLAHCECEQRGD